MPKLELAEARRSINGKPFLGPLSLLLELRGITAIVGPNGAGKSLFLALCHGIDRPDAGVVTWDGAPAYRTRRTRSFMLQSPTVLRRTVAANVDYPLAGHMPGAARRQAVAEVLAQARLTGKANAPAATLSGGELRRMALARAQVTRPAALLLDEPFAGLDPASAAEIEARITEIALTTPVLMSTHDLVQTRRVADHVLFFSDGQLIESAPTAEFFDSGIAQTRTFLQGGLL